MTVDLVDATYYNDVTRIVLGDYTIGKKTITVTANDITIRKGDDMPIPTVYYYGFVGADNENNVFATKAVAKLTVLNTSVADITTIDFKTLAVLDTINDKNYALVHRNGLLTIEPSVNTIDIPQANPLKAYVNNGTLHVSGLNAGETWKVYSMSGALIHQAVANSDVEETLLQVRGVYVIQSEKRILKIVY